MQSDLKCVDSFSDFQSKIDSQEAGGGEWIYRGQACSWELKPTLERTLTKWLGSSTSAAKYEDKLIREFQRGYNGGDRKLVLKNTCNCLALMQHHGAPTRLLDWTYSPYVAARFALEHIKVAVPLSGA